MLLLWPASTCMVKLFLTWIHTRTEGSLNCWSVLHVTAYILTWTTHIIHTQHLPLSLCLSLLVAGEKGTVFALEELLATVAVPVVPTQALHVPGAELAELASEDTVWSIVSHCWATRCWAGRHLTAGGQLVMTKLLTNVRWLQVRWV